MQNLIPQLTQDLRFALRQLRRAPGFAITAILTLALGVGANTAIFSLLDQALLRSLPVHDPTGLVILNSSDDTWSGSSSKFGGKDEDYFSYPMYKDLRDQNKFFSGLLATTAGNAGFSRGNASQVVDAEIISGNYFTLLGVQPSLGRLFTASDDAAEAANPLVVLSFDFWRNHLAADPSILNSTVSLNGHPFQVIGIAAPNFHSAVWGQTPSIFLTMSMRESITTHAGTLLDHRSRWLNIIARLAPGVTPSQAQAGLQPLWHALRAEELKALGSKSPRFVAGFLTNNHLLLTPGARGYSYTRSNLETPFLAVMAMAALVLLIAAVNVASLLLVRSAARIKEFSLRLALGAAFSRIVVQLLLEGLLIGLAGGIVGLLLAPAALHVLVNRLSTPDSQTPWSASIDLRVLLFNFAVALTVALVFSLAPALQLRRLNITGTLRQASSTSSGSLLSLRRVIVSLQIGLSVILLVGAGLFLRTMQQLRAVNVGFNTAHLAAFDLDPTLTGYKSADMPALQQQIFTATAALPGVTGVAATNDSELANNNTTANVSVAGYTPPPEDDFTVEVPVVSPNYFTVMAVPLLAGRTFAETDTLDHPKVAIVNATFAQHFCGTPHACLGRHMALGAGNTLKLDTEIVGVTQDSHHTDVRNLPKATFFRPLQQAPGSTDALTFYLRNFGDSSTTLAAIPTTLRRLSPGLAPTALRSMSSQIDQSLQNERLITLLAVSFGVLATLLAGIGLYGVLAFSTAQRTREIGIRMALGSSRLAITSLVLTDVFRLAAIGLVIALPTAFALSRLIRTQLFGVTAADPVILISVVSLILLTALAAAALPVHRAASVEPTQALRSE